MPSVMIYTSNTTTSNTNLWNLQNLRQSGFQVSGCRLITASEVPIRVDFAEDKPLAA